MTVSAARLFVSIPMAMSVTFGLLLLMQLLISTGQTVITPKPYFDIDLITVRDETPVDNSIKRVDPPPPVDPHPPIRPPVDRIVDATVIEIAPPVAPIEKQTFQYQTTLMDGDMYPISRVVPTYPMRAVTMNLEGYVVVEFTVTRTGSVTDIVVVESSHSVFNRSAIQAISKFKYRPRIVNGEPVPVSGVQYKLTFKFDN